MRTIRTSEIGTFLYCQRAWWYHKQGKLSDNLAQMAAGSEFHYHHTRAAMNLKILRLLSFFLMLLSLIITASYLVNLAIP
jgi:CRISPR/Cas system-associated exonuclease Cas4 (RecB family)